MIFEDGKRSVFPTHQVALPLSLPGEDTACLFPLRTPSFHSQPPLLRSPPPKAAGQTSVRTRTQGACWNGDSSAHLQGTRQVPPVQCLINCFLRKSPHVLDHILRKMALQQSFWSFNLWVNYLRILLKSCKPYAGPVNLMLVSFSKKLPYEA